jgi:hypothetical protein
MQHLVLMCAPCRLMIYMQCHMQHNASPTCTERCHVLTRPPLPPRTRFPFHRSESAHARVHPSTHKPTCRRACVCMRVALPHARTRPCTRPTLLVGGGVVSSAWYLGMKPVSTSPALKAGWSRISLWKGPVVGTPTITVSSSARSMRVMAWAFGAGVVGVTAWNHVWSWEGAMGWVASDASVVAASADLCPPSWIAFTPTTLIPPR